MSFDALVQDAYNRLAPSDHNWLTTLDAQYDLGLGRTPDLVYHYTTVTGLKGIIENNSLWATNLAYLNDSSEYSYGLQMIVEALNSVINPDPTGAGARIAQRVKSLIASRTRSEVYVCCLTEERDQLSQWRGYAQQGTGYVIGLDRAALLSYVRPFSVSGWLVYKQQAHQDFCTHLVESFSAYTAILPAADLDDWADILAARLVEDIEDSIPLFKDFGFYEEKEFRLIVKNHDGSSDANLKFRTSDNLLIPYLELKSLHGPHLPIKEIRTGPKVNHEKAKQSISMLLKQRGYRNVDIRPSDIPFV